MNTLVSTVSKVTESLSSDGYKLIETSQIPDQTAGIKWMAVDDHIDNVITLPPKTDLHSHKLVKRGAIILQDKVWRYGTNSVALVFLRMFKLLPA